MRIYFTADTNFEMADHAIIKEISSNPNVFKTIENIYYLDVSESELFDMYDIQDNNLSKYIWNGSYTEYLYLTETNEYENIDEDIEIDWDKAYDEFGIVDEIEYTEIYENGKLVYSDKPDVKEICKTLLNSCAIDFNIPEEILYHKNRIKQLEKLLNDN